MYVRKKKNKSGIISVQVIDKSTRSYKVKKTIGSSADLAEVEKLVARGKEWIDSFQGALHFDFDNSKKSAKHILDNISQISVCGTAMLLGNIFNEIGFNKIDSPLFKPLVLSRLENPVSKLKTTDYWFKYHNISVDISSIYRYLDKLHETEQETIQRISFEHTQKILGTDIQMVFYDVTTLYFEAEQEDEFRKRGFSKDGKSQCPQIVLGLLVSSGGYPLAYDVFEGNKYEGETMLPIVDAFKQKYGFKKVTIVADAGLINNKNVEELTTKNYSYILGARIKNEKRSIKEQILQLQLISGQSHTIEKDKNTSLIINYSDKRAKKDRHNRERGLKRLEKQLAQGRLTKANINNRGYNKFLKMKGEISIEIDEEKFKEDAKWDGLKGYQTNSKLSSSAVIESYQHLWKIEKAFRVSKTDLKIRPIYHRLQNRIESHICLSFVAYKIYKELERQLYNKKADLSPEKAIEIAKTIYKVTINIEPTETVEKVILLKEEQKLLAQLFNLV